MKNNFKEDDKMKKNNINIKQTRISNFVWAVVRWFFLINIAFIIIYPLVYMISMAVRSPIDFLDATVVWIPKHFTLDNFKKIIFEAELWNPLLNTFIVTFFCGIAQLLVTSLTGYGFARFKFKGCNILFVFVLITIAMPPQMINIPNYLIMRNLDFYGIIKLIIGTPSPVSLINSPLSFIIPAVLGQGLKSGLFILIFRQFFLGIPNELEEAAMIDGCSHLKTFFKIMLPNAKTALIICGTFVASWYWTDYDGPYLFYTSKRTISMQLIDFNSLIDKYLTLSQQNAYYRIPLQQAACIFCILPRIILFLFSQKFFAQGIERSGLVG